MSIIHNSSDADIDDYVLFVSIASAKEEPTRVK